MSRNCASCAFYSAGAEVTQSQCRANPPSVFVVVLPMQSGSLAGSGVRPTPVPITTFPNVEPKHWCGKWEHSRPVVN